MLKQITLAGLLLAALAPFAISEEPVSELAQYYGFKKLEVFKLQQRSANMLAADLNNDGRADLVLIDNSNSRLDVLQQRDKPPANAAPKSSKVNAVENDWRFDHQKVAVDRAVAALAVGDFNGDGRKDLAYFSPPDQLSIRLQSEKGEWSAAKRHRLADVQTGQWIIAAGDLNSDSKEDLIVLGKHSTYILYQKDGELAAPTRIMNTSENIGLAQIADLDGDGRNDLCYLAQDDSERPFCARLQGKDGRLGPEIRCELPKPRGVTLADADGKPGLEVLAIEATTGRVKVHQLQRPEVQAGELAGQLIQYGFGQQGTGRNRDLASGDVNGDGLIDVVVTDPESAQMIVFLQQKGAGLDQGNMYPGLVGAEQVRLGDFDGDKKAEVVVLSTREKTIGTSRMEGGRLTFPQPIITEKEPASLELADLNLDGKPEIVYIGKERTSTSSKYTLQALARNDKGEWKPHLFGQDSSITLTLKGTPERLVALDANNDGRVDFLIFTGSERAPQCLLANEQGKYTEITGEGGFGLGNVAAGGLFLGNLDKHAILVTQNNFARNVEVGENGQWRVVDQYNAAEAEAKIAGAATIDLDGQPGREIVLVDLGVKKLRVLRKENNVFRPWREVEIGTFPYKSTHVADLNGDGRDDLLVFGTGKFGVLYAGQSDPRLKTLSSYETKLEHTHFSDLAAGDLNGDGQLDVAVLDTKSQFLVILNYHPETGLRHVVYFKIFEAKSLADEEHSGAEPREALIADVTGDGLADLVLLSHDRVLLYPQDNGKDDEPPKAGGGK